MEQLMEQLAAISERNSCSAELLSEIDMMFDMCSTAGQIGRPSVEAVRQYVEPRVRMLDACTCDMPQVPTFTLRANHLNPII